MEFFKENAVTNQRGHYPQRLDADIQILFWRIFLRPFSACTSVNNFIISHDDQMNKMVSPIVRGLGFETDVANEHILG